MNTVRDLWSGQTRVTGWAWAATLGAALMIAPLIGSLDYVFLGALGAGLVAALGAVLRSVRTPWPLTVLAQVVAGTEWSLFAFARGDLAFGLFPTRDAFAALGQQVQDFNAVVARFAAPIPDGPGVTATLAIGVVALAIIVDMVALGWGQVPVLGLVFLGVYMAPVALLSGSVSMFAFIPGALGFVFLMAAEQRERLVRWGRQVADSTRGTGPAQVDASRLIASGRQVGLTAVALAVVLPLLIPTFSPRFFGTGGTGGDGSSGRSDGQVTVTNPVLDLRRNLSKSENTLLVSFSTTDPNPEYVRLASLSEFTGTAWEPGERLEEDSVTVSSRLPGAPGLGTIVDRTPVRYNMVVSEDFVTSWLPTIYAPTGIDVGGDWRLDLTNYDVLSSDGEPASGISYTFDSVVAAPTATLLRGAGPYPRELQPFTDLPGDLPTVIADTARQVTASATNPFDQAVALQTWFRTSGGFTYSLETAPGSGIDTITKFITTQKIGYCEQFAGAMALMARSLDIPTRVAVGMLKPTRLDDGTYQYRANDMHAWPELYFEGVGWVRFEPTPGDRTGAPPSFTNPDPGQTAETPTVTPTATNTPAERPSSQPSQDTAAGGGPGGSGPWNIIGLLVLVVAALVGLVCAPRLARRTVSRRRWSRALTPAETAEAAWMELRDCVLDLAIGWDDQITARSMGRRLRPRVDADDDAVRALNHVVQFVEQGRYARNPSDSADAQTSVETVRRTLKAGSTAKMQWRSEWLPRSLVVGSGRIRPRRRALPRDQVVTVSD